MPRKLPLHRQAVRPASNQQSFAELLASIEREAEARIRLIDDIPASDETRALLHCLMGFPHTVVGTDWLIVLSWEELKPKLLKKSTNTVKKYVRAAMPFVEIVTGFTDKNPNTKHTFAIHWMAIIDRESQAAICTAPATIEPQTPGQAAICTAGESEAAFGEQPERAANCTPGNDFDSPDYDPWTPMIGKRVVLPAGAPTETDRYGTIRAVLDEGERYIVHWDATDTTEDFVRGIRACHVRGVSKPSEEGVNSNPRGCQNQGRGCQTEGVISPHTPSENLLPGTNTSSTLLLNPSSNQASTERAPRSSRSRGRESSFSALTITSWSRWQQAVESRRLDNPEHVLELYAIAVQLQAVEHSEEICRQFFAQAARNERLWASRSTSKTPVLTRQGIFISNVPHGRWTKAEPIDYRVGDRMIRRAYLTQPGARADVAASVAQVADATAIQELGRDKLLEEVKRADVERLKSKYPTIVAGKNVPSERRGE